MTRPRTMTRAALAAVVLAGTVAAAPAAPQGATHIDRIEDPCGEHEDVGDLTFEARDFVEPGDIAARDVCEVLLSRTVDAAGELVAMSLELAVAGEVRPDVDRTYLVSLESYAPGEGRSPIPGEERDGGCRLDLRLETGPEGPVLTEGGTCGYVSGVSEVAADLATWWAPVATDVATWTVGGSRLVIDLTLDRHSPELEELFSTASEGFVLSGGTDGDPVGPTFDRVDELLVPLHGEAPAVVLTRPCPGRGTQELDGGLCDGDVTGTLEADGSLSSVTLSATVVEDGEVPPLVSWSAATCDLAVQVERAADGTHRVTGGAPGCVDRRGPLVTPETEAAVERFLFGEPGVWDVTLRPVDDAFTILGALVDCGAAVAPNPTSPTVPDPEAAQAACEAFAETLVTVAAEQVDRPELVGFVERAVAELPGFVATVGGELSEGTVPALLANVDGAVRFHEWVTRVHTTELEGAVVVEDAAGISVTIPLPTGVDELDTLFTAGRTVEGVMLAQHGSLRRWSVHLGDFVLPGGE